MKFPKILIPFLAVVLPTVHFANNDINGNQSYSKIVSNLVRNFVPEKSHKSIMLR